MRCLALLVASCLALAPQTKSPTISLPPSRFPTTAVPTPVPTPFQVPTLPLSKANALYPQCRAELFFAIDVSGSVCHPHQKIMFTFVDEMIVTVDENIGSGRYGVVVFGIDARTANWPSVSFNYGNISTTRTGPYGNQVQPASTEVFLSLDHLRYNCTECYNISAAWSQLEMLFAVVFGGWLTPTWDALDMINDQYQKYGDPTVPSRFIILVTDGVPNNYNCLDCNILTTTNCIVPINLTNISVAALKASGSLLITVGMGLIPETQALMYFWASEPRDILAIPVADYYLLQGLIPQLLAVMCPQGTIISCLSASATTIDITGSNFLNTGEIICQFNREGASLQKQTPGIFVRDDLLRCPLPTSNFFPGTWDLSYSLDGRGFHNVTSFKWGTVCQPELLVIWWPFCALALLPLAFCRPARAAPVKTQKVSRGVARPAPAATEEYEEYEEVEEIVAPPQPVNKWKVAPTAYLGFGRARMSVDWAGVAPESAPHEGVRKKVVKKVVTDTAPVPTAGPAGVPQPAAQPQEEYTSSAPASRPPTVEEPDWVNSCLDRVAAIFCSCCVKK